MLVLSLVSMCMAERSVHDAGGHISLKVYLWCVVPKSRGFDGTGLKIPASNDGLSFVRMWPFFRYLQDRGDTASESEFLRFLARSEGTVFLADVTHLRAVGLYNDRLSQLVQGEEAEVLQGRLSLGGKSRTSGPGTRPTSTELVNSIAVHNV